MSKPSSKKQTNNVGNNILAETMKKNQEKDIDNFCLINYVVL